MLRQVDTRLRDGTGWRALAYVVVRVPVSLLQVYALSLWVTGGYALLSPVWWLLFRHHGPGVHLHPAQIPTAFFTTVAVSSWPGTLPVCLIGAATPLAAGPGPAARPAPYSCRVVSVTTFATSRASVLTPGSRMLRSRSHASPPVKIAFGPPPVARDLAAATA